MYEANIKGPIADKFHPWHYPNPALWKEAKDEDLCWPESTELALYLHIPFCEERCSYCNFEAYMHRKEQDIRQYVKSLKKEIDLYAKKSFVGKTIVRSVYLGGGTPSFIKSELLFEVLEHLKRTFNFSNDFEFSLESNPCTLTSRKLKTLKELGVNRLSIGVQSFSDEILKLMNRFHSSKEAINSIEQAKKTGFDNINIDLIYGYPGESLGSWKTSLDTAISLDPGRITCTALTVWPKTATYQQIVKKQIPLISEAYDAKALELAYDTITRFGYKPYTALSFSRDESNVWQQQQAVLSGRMPLLGMGLSALSVNGNFGAINERSLRNYNEIIAAGRLPIMRAQKISSRLSKSIRIIQSVKVLSINKQGYLEEVGKPVTKYYGRRINRLVNEGFFEEDAKTIKLTKKGILYMGYVSRAFYLPLDLFKIKRFFSKHYFPLVSEQ